MIHIIKMLHLILAFSLEIILVVTTSYWGFQQGKTSIAKYFLAIILPIVVIIAWGIFAAPKSQYRLDLIYLLIFQLVLFLMAASLLYNTNHHTFAIVFVMLALLSLSLEFIFK